FRPMADVASVEHADSATVLACRGLIPLKLRRTYAALAALLLGGCTPRTMPALVDHVPCTEGVPVVEVRVIGNGVSRSFTGQEALKLYPKRAASLALMGTATIQCEPNN